MIALFVEYILANLKYHFSDSSRKGPAQLHIICLILAKSNNLTMITRPLAGNLGVFWRTLFHRSTAIANSNAAAFTALK